MPENSRDKVCLSDERKLLTESMSKIEDNDQVNPINQNYNNIYNNNFLIDTDIQSRFTKHKSFKLARGPELIKRG